MGWVYLLVWLLIFLCSRLVWLVWRLYFLIMWVRIYCSEIGLCFFWIWWVWVRVVVLLLLFVVSRFIMICWDCFIWFC